MTTIYKISDRYKIDCNTYLLKIYKGKVVMGESQFHQESYYQYKKDENKLTELVIKNYLICDDGGTKYLSFEYNDELHSDFTGRLIIPHNLKQYENDEILRLKKTILTVINTNEIDAKVLDILKEQTEEWVPQSLKSNK